MIAKQLFAEAGDNPTPKSLAALAVKGMEQLTQHLSVIVGEPGIRALLSRSAARSSLTFVWLAGTIVATESPDGRWDGLRAALVQQDPRTLRDGFIELLSTFIELLEKLIGRGLVRRLLHDVWTDAVPQAVKETT